LQPKAPPKLRQQDETNDLAAGQTIAVLYAVADKENILLVAVIKPVETK
jgi:hypothetical protein